jgi:hypothetical protein
MISPLMNAIVIAAIGFFMGIVLQIAVIIMPARERPLHSISFNTGLRGFIDSTRKNADQDAEFYRHAPRQFWSATLAFYGLIAILVLVIVYSPLTMNWPVFLVALVAAAGVSEGIFERAKAGKFPLGSSSSNHLPPSSAGRE